MLQYLHLTIDIYVVDCFVEHRIFSINEIASTIHLTSSRSENRTKRNTCNVNAPFLLEPLVILQEHLVIIYLVSILELDLTDFHKQTPATHSTKQKDIKNET